MIGIVSCLIALVVSHGWSAEQGTVVGRIGVVECNGVGEAQMLQSFEDTMHRSLHLPGWEVTICEKAPVRLQLQPAAMLHTFIILSALDCDLLLCTSHSSLRWHLVMLKDRLLRH